MWISWSGSKRGGTARSKGMEESSGKGDNFSIHFKHMYYAGICSYNTHLTTPCPPPSTSPKEPLPDH